MKTKRMQGVCSAIATLAAFAGPVFVVQGASAEPTTGNTSEAIRVGALPLLKQHNYSLFLQRLNQALSMAIASHNQTEEAKDIADIGICCEETGQDAQSLKDFQKALSLATRTNNGGLRRILLYDIGTLYSRAGQHQTALTYFNQAQISASNQKSVPAQIQILISEALELERLKEYPQESAKYSAAITLSQGLPDPSIEENLINRLANLDEYLRKDSDAIVLYETSLSIAQAHNHKLVLENDLSDIGGAYMYEHQYDKALSWYQQAYSLEQTIGHPRGEEDDLYNIALAKYYLRSYRDAETYLEQSLIIATKISDYNMQRHDLNDLCAITKDLKETDKAADYFDELEALDANHPAK